MDLEKGDQVVLTTAIGDQPAGAKGVVIRVEQPWFTGTKYNVLLDSGEVLERLTEDDLYAPGKATPTS